MKARSSSVSPSKGVPKRVLRNHSTASAKRGHLRLGDYIVTISSHLYPEGHHLFGHLPRLRKVIAHSAASGHVRDKDGKFAIFFRKQAQVRVFHHHLTSRPACRIICPVLRRTTRLPWPEIVTEPRLTGWW